METVQTFIDFFEAIADDTRIGTTHICLYFALLKQSNDSLQCTPIILNRDSLMVTARISRRTYHKCLKELQEYGYIKYEPSSNPYSGSKVYLNRL